MKLTVPPFEALTLLIFGQPGSGKTRFCAGDFNSIFAATEPGQDFTKARVINIVAWDGDLWEVSPNRVKTSFKKFVHTIAEQLKSNSLDASAIVIDIVDNLHTLCMDAVCTRKGIAHPHDANDFGATWAAVNKEWTSWLRALMSKINIRFISHCAERPKEVTNDIGIKEEVTQYLPTFSGNKAAQYLDGVVNAMGFMTKNKSDKYVLTFKQTATIAAKDRTDILSSLGEILLPNSPDESWGYVSKLYRDKATELGFEVQTRRN